MCQDRLILFLIFSQSSRSRSSKPWCHMPTWTRPKSHGIYGKCAEGNAAIRTNGHCFKHMQSIFNSSQPVPGLLCCGSLHCLPSSGRYFITSLSHRLSPQSLPTYLSGIPFYNIQQGFGHLFPGMLHLKPLIKGIKRSKGLSKKPPRLPVTVTILKFLHKAILSSTLLPCDKSILWSACCLASYGFLRASEFTSLTESSFSPYQTLLLSDITFGHDNSLLVRIKMSKVDSFPQGHVLSIAPAGSYVCAEASMRQYLAFRSSTLGQLYVFRDGTYFAKNILNLLLKESRADK